MERRFINQALWMIGISAALLAPAVSTSFGEMTEAFRSAVELDWAQQEQRWDREPADLESIRAALKRGELLLADLSSMPDGPNMDQEQSALRRHQEQAYTMESSDEAERLSLYHQIRWLIREAAFKNPLVGDEKIVFLKRKRFICQMLHEYLGYFYDYEDIAGGGVYILEEPGQAAAYNDLIQDRLPRGNYTTLALSYDAKKIYFGFAERAEQKPDYYSKDRRCFHIYAMDADGTNLRQLTDGLYDDFDPCPLPDGGIAFMSTRRGGFGRCHNPWEPLPAYTLHRMNPDGTNIQTLSFHETNEWHPSVLHDGRIVYIRWDYVDRSAANFHGLWVSNPDGSNPRALFGNFTKRVNACYQPKAIPGSNRIVFIAGAHHADVGGSLVIVDPDRLTLDEQTGEDDFCSLDILTPEICFPEAAGWPKNYFHSPWPLSENYFLTAFSFDPLPGMGPKVKKDTETGLYLYDRFGNMELLYKERGISCMYPIPLRPREIPPVIPSALDPQLGDEGEYMLTNIAQSQFSLPESRPVRELRVFQILPKSETHVANRPRLGHANAESARMFLGAIPVEEDGSAYFRAPARKPLAFQAVDKTGRAIQIMRSVTYVQPGERRGCIGCHESTGVTESKILPLAMRREPSRIEPGPSGSHPWSYPRLVQPILNKHCVRCHNGAEREGKTLFSLMDTPVDSFTASYINLKPYVRWYEWGDNTIDPIVTKPGRTPSVVSPLVLILENNIHKTAVGLSDEERRRLYLWLDGNASFYGCYQKDSLLAQHRGESIPPPKLQ